MIEIIISIRHKAFLLLILKVYFIYQLWGKLQMICKFSEILSNWDNCVLRDQKRMLSEVKFC